MMKKSTVFIPEVVRAYEQHLSGFSPREQSLSLKFFINKAGIVRQQLPSESNENSLMDELCGQMSRPLPGAVVARARALLAADRDERMSENIRMIMRKGRSKKIVPGIGTGCGR